MLAPLLHSHHIDGSTGSFDWVCKEWLHLRAQFTVFSAQLTSTAVFFFLIFVQSAELFGPTVRPLENHLLSQLMTIKGKRHQQCRSSSQPASPSCRHSPDLLP